MSMPLPATGGLVAAFYGFLAADDPRLQRCTGCGAFRHLPRYLCPSCHADGWEWAVVSGEGEVFSWTTTLRPLHPAFADLPMIVATVTLAEGPRLLGRLVDIAPEAVTVGLPVRLTRLALADGVAVPRFVPG